MAFLHFLLGFGIVSCAFLSFEAAAPPCQRTINIPSTQQYLTNADFNDPDGYPDYTFCRYLITGPPNTRMSLDFVSLDLEVYPNCAADSLRFFDIKPTAVEEFTRTAPCRNIPTPTYGPLCANSSMPLPARFLSRRNIVAVEFCTDYAIGGRGFNISITHQPLQTGPAGESCSYRFGLPNITNTQSIMSPGFPDKYDDFQKCDWGVSINRNYPLRIDFREVYLGRDCEDKLHIIDVTNNRNYTTCGSYHQEPYIVIPSTSEIRIEFIPDDWEGTDKGFRLVLSYDACNPGEIACDDGIGCVRATLQCDRIRQCQDGSDEKEEYCAPECGMPHFPIDDDRIVGGFYAPDHSLPWQTAMLSGGRQFCGGSLISDRWVVTAAHCFNPPGSSLTVRVGGHHLYSTAEDDNAVEIDVEKVFVYPNYVPRQYDADFCLVKLAQPVRFQKNIVPICLPRQGNDVAPGTVCVTSGWGNTQKPNNTSPTELRQIYVPVVSRERCNATAVYNGGITESMICAGLEVGGKDSCQGDSGGPFVCKSDEGRWYLNGIVSWGQGCALPTHPGVYARTGCAVDWMIDTIARN